MARMAGQKPMPPSFFDSSVPLGRLELSVAAVVADGRGPVVTVAAQSLCAAGVGLGRVGHLNTMGY